jgi:hypothetical protein
MDIRAVQPPIIGFTGHRDQACKPGQLAEIAGQYPKAVWLHGGAPGFDSQVDEFGRANLPVPPVILRPNYKLFDPSVAPLKRNEEIVHLCGLLVALYDGRPTGGTAFTVAYALKRGVWVINLWAQAQERRRGWETES